MGLGTNPANLLEPRLRLSVELFPDCTRTKLLGSWPETASWDIESPTGITMGFQELRITWVGLKPLGGLMLGSL